MFMNKSAHYIFVYILFVSCGSSYEVYQGIKNRLIENLICEYLIHKLICACPMHNDIRSSAGVLIKQRETRPNLQRRKSIENLRRILPHTGTQTVRWVIYIPFQTPLSCLLSRAVVSMTTTQDCGWLVTDPKSTEPTRPHTKWPKC